MNSLRLLAVCSAFVLVLPAASAGEFSGLAAGLLALHSKPAPIPTPKPSPSDVCPNCEGRGKLGDGTVFVVCPECNGTGKRTTAEAYAVASAPPGWTCTPEGCFPPPAARSATTCGPEGCTCAGGCTCPDCPARKGKPIKAPPRPAVALPALAATGTPAGASACSGGACSASTAAPRVIRSRVMTPAERWRLFPNRKRG